MYMRYIMAFMFTLQSLGLSAVAHADGSEKPACLQIYYQGNTKNLMAQKMIEAKSPDEWTSDFCDQVAAAVLAQTEAGCQDGTCGDPTPRPGAQECDTSGIDQNLVSHVQSTTTTQSAGNGFNNFFSTGGGIWPLLIGGAVGFLAGNAYGKNQAQNNFNRMVMSSPGSMYAPRFVQPGYRGGGGSNLPYGLQPIANYNYGNLLGGNNGGWSTNWNNTTGSYLSAPSIISTGGGNIFNGSSSGGAPAIVPYGTNYQ